VALGATWIPIEIYEEFIKDLLQLKQKPQVLYINRLGKWIVTIPETARNSVLNTITFGTMDMTAAKIIECSMNAKTIKVYDTIPQLGKKDLRIINKSKTYAALEKQNTIIREFENWVMEVPKRKETLQDCYNEAFVGYITSKYDGSVLDFPDLNPEIHLYPRQRNTLARLLFSRENVLVPHKVGSGKTYIMVCAAHELHRIGMSKKNMIVVPNNVLQGTVSAHKLLYPKDKILVITPESFVGEAKNQFLYEIQTHGDEYIAIYMAYSSFDQVNMSKGYWIERRRSEIRDLRRATANAKTKREALQLRSAADRLAKKLSEYVLEGKDTLLIPFEDLGINTLFVDEAHNYKNIELHSR
jgi:N12 class adenine-specific DNA methylase